VATRPIETSASYAERLLLRSSSVGDPRTADEHRNSPSTRPTSSVVEPTTASSPTLDSVFPLIQAPAPHSAEPLLLRKSYAEDAGPHEESGLMARLPGPAADPAAKRTFVGGERLSERHSGGHIVSELGVTDSSTSPQARKVGTLTNTLTLATPLAVATAAQRKTPRAPGVFRQTTSAADAPVRTAEPRIASEISGASLARRPEIIWRKSVVASPAASLISTQTMVGGAAVVARQDGEDISAPSAVASPPSIHTGAAHSASSEGSGGDLDRLIRALYRRLAVERERRGNGR